VRLAVHRSEVKGSAPELFNWCVQVEPRRDEVMQRRDVAARSGLGERGYGRWWGFGRLGRVINKERDNSRGRRGEGEREGEKRGRKGEGEGGEEGKQQIDGILRWKR
jgi:hypothetical protein